MLSKERKKKLEQNIWKYYIYRAICCLMFIAPIWILFLLDNGLSMTQVMIIQAIYTAIIMLFAIPFGILADYIGRKKVLVFSTVIFAIAWFIYASSHTFMWFVIAEIIWGFSASSFMSSGTAFFYDNLRELKREKSFKRLFGNVVGIQSIMYGLSALAGGYIATYSNLRMPFFVSAITAVFALLVSFSFTDTERYKHGDKKYFAHLKDAVKFASTHPRVRLFIIYSSMMFSIAFLCYMLYQPYLKSIGITLIYFGWIYFAINMLSACGSKLAHRIEKFLGERKILIILVSVALLSYFGMSQGLMIIGVIFPLILAFNFGTFEPVINDYMNKHIESHHRATVLSLGNLVTQAFSTTLAPFIGWIVDFWSLSTAFLMAMILMIINLVILITAFWFIKRK